VGACVDPVRWGNSGRQPAELVGRLKERLITVDVHPFDGPAGEGAGNAVDQVLAGLLSEIGRLAVRPTMVGIRSSQAAGQPAAQTAKTVESLKQLAVQLAAER
jgi:hypothetical protein